jgi:2-polyprenyl-3-methyl-5-hydroxy-6-metoxy-1,4-benzoquinol methylase
MDAQSHWEKIYTEKAATAVSWYRSHLETSLALIERVAPKDSAIIDVGGGESTLVDDLLAHGYEDITILDISHRAIEENKKRLGSPAERVHWLVADITKAEFSKSAYDVWHDRAVFHFLTQQSDRIAYVRQAAHAVKLGGYVIVSTLLLRKMIGAGTPRALRDLVERVFFLLFWLISVTRAISVPLPSFRGSISRACRIAADAVTAKPGYSGTAGLDTGC